MVGIGSVVYCASEYVKHTSVDWKGLKLAEFSIKLPGLAALKIVNRMDADIVHIAGNSITGAGNLL
jgi:hypothetical protein